MRGFDDGTPLADGELADELSAMLARYLDCS